MSWSCSTFFTIFSSYVILSVVVLMLSLLSALRFFEENSLQSIIDIIYIFISLYMLSYIRKSKYNGQKATPYILIIFFILASLSFLNTDIDLIGASWFITLLLPTYYLGGIKFGLRVTFTSIVIIYILLQMKEDSHTFLEYLYLLIPVIFSSIFIYVYEKRIDKMKNLLHIKNFDLEKKVAEKEKLLKQAHYDALTKLPNRVLFSDRIQQAIAKANRYKKDFAVFFIDLDKFKEINDTLGHDAGDFVLCKIASRFKRSLREEDTISRFGGDEFVCIIEELESCHKASSLAQKLIRKMKEPMLFEGSTISLTCSIGISIYPKDATDEKTLLHQADSAMYVAKAMGSDNYQFYSTC